MSKFDIVTLCFEIISLMAILALGPLLLTVISRQQRDLRDNRRLLAAVAAYAAVQEEDSRRTRHAVKEIAAILKMRGIIESLEKPPDDDHTALAVERVQAAVRRAERSRSDGE